MGTRLFRYGAIAGIALSIAFFAPYFLFGPQPSWLRYGQLFGYSAMALSMTATYFAMRSERRRRGSLTFSRGLAIGAGVALVGAAIFGAATWAFYAIVGDALPQLLWDHYVAQIRASGHGEAEIAQQLASMESMRPLFFNYVFQAVLMFASLFLIGVAISLVSATLLRRRTQPT